MEVGFDNDDDDVLGVLAWIQGQIIEVRKGVSLPPKIVFEQRGVGDYARSIATTKLKPADIVASVASSYLCIAVAL
ncbi:hypothetical protein Tco_0724180 [Tanacetum coccineum]